MSPVVCTRSDKDDIWMVIPARWRPCREVDGRRSASVSCPGCGRVCSLTDHEIGADGTVSPSVVCGYDDCTFHDYLVLRGWTP